MIKKLLLGIALLAWFGSNAQTTYQLNYDYITLGKPTGLGTNVLRGIVKLPSLTTGTSTDSVLVISLGRAYMIARSTFNSATATALANSRTIWGQLFNGTANVSGALTGVTGITTNGGYAQSGSTANRFTGTASFGIETTTTPQVIITGGQSGGAILRLRRTQGVVSTQEISIGANGTMFRDSTSQNIHLSAYSDISTESQVVAGVKSLSSSSTRISAFKGTTWSTLTNFAANGLKIVGQLGTGNGASSNIDIYGAVPTVSGTTAQTEGLIYRGNYTNGHQWNINGTKALGLAVVPSANVLLKTDASNNIVAAVEGVDYLSTNTIKYGATIVTFDGVQTVFNIPHGMSSAPTSFAVTFGDASNLNIVQSVRTVTSTNIVLTCSSPPLAGSQTIYWQAFK